MSAKPNTKLNQLMSLELSRKQFIVGIFGSLVGLMGFSGLIGFLTDSVAPQTQVNPGYGKAKYGP